MRKFILIITILIPLFISINIFSNEKIIRDIDKAFINAVINEDINAIKDAIQKRANINVIIKEEGDFYGYNALMIASYKGNLEIVKLLIKSKAAINTTSLESYTSKVVYPLLISLERGFKEIAETLLLSGAKAELELPDNLALTPLFLAIEKNYPDIVELLIKRKANINRSVLNQETMPPDDITPLIFASKKGNLQIVKMLVNAGARVNHETALGNNTLIEASSGKKPEHIEIVKYLIAKKVNINKANKNTKLTPLLCALMEKNIGTAKLLIIKGANVNIASSYEGNTLHYAVKSGDIELVKLILIRFKLDINNLTQQSFRLTDNGYNSEYDRANNLTALMIASHINNPEIVKLLIKRGASVNRKNQLDNSALKIAKTKGFNEIVDILIKAGAKE